ncbi:Nif3-like dinuclear metal center hexameric protein [Thioalkalicoccus limnaeus]|uniref:Nif3-like dinuclear metal center hexameric protein n=1 Tax=Thioalkalicoccus limnaeus TaxID=120681 RepID=A0ABV4BI01_9GAMM
MTIDVHALRAYCDGLLEVGDASDYCPNGLQIEGDRPIQRLATGVTACQALIDEALDWGADAIIVHHGYFWKGEAQPLVGIKGRRVRALMRAGVSLLAYHLPLDRHPELGNNHQLGLRFGFVGAVPVSAGDGLLWQGRLPEPLSGARLATLIAEYLGRQPVHVPVRSGLLDSVAWCTGAAQDHIEEAAALGVDAFVSGEISERTTHLARELGLDYFAAGHHATERYGVAALGAHLAERFAIAHRFIDIENPA